MESAWVILIWIVAYGVEPEEAIVHLLMKPCTDVCDVQADAIMNITCSLLNDVTDYPFRWYLRNEPKEIELKTEINQAFLKTPALSSLRYQASREHHGWHMSCLAYTTRGYVESNISTLNVLYPPAEPRFRVDTHVLINNYLNAIDGRDVGVECDVDSNPHSKILWKHNSEIVSENKTLVFHNVTQNDAGKYVCFARNMLRLASGETNYGNSSNHLQIEVWNPPTVPEVTYGGAVIATGVFKVICTRQIVLECRSSGKPTPSIHWEMYPNYIVNSSRLELPDQKSGITTCVAENLMPELYDQHIPGRSEKSVYVDVLQSPSTPSFIIDGKNTFFNKDKVALIKGSPFSLKCKSQGNPVPVIIMHNGTSQRSVFGSMNLHNINIATTRTFLCIATNFMHPTFGPNDTGKAEKSLTIEILFPQTEPILSMNGSPLNNTTLSIMSAENVSIECTSNGYPPPNIRWEHELNIYNDSILKLINVQESNEGTYICVVENTMTPTFGPETIGRSNLSLQLIVQSARSGGSSHHSDLLLPLLGAGCGTLLLLAATVLVCVCRKRKMRDGNDVVENPMYISADDVLAHEPSTASQAVDDVVENPMYISADGIGRKKVARQANAKGQVGQSQIYSVPYVVHKADTVVLEEDEHYAEIID